MDRRGGDSAWSPAQAVGERVLELRTARGMTLGALAATTALGKGTLSELERGLRNPTLETLFAIATALGAPLTALLPAQPATPCPPRTADGAGLLAQPLGEWQDDDRTYAAYRVHIPATEQAAPHSPGTHEILTLLTGQVRVGPDDDPRTLNPYQTTSYPADRPHSYHAIDGLAAGLLTLIRPHQVEHSLEGTDEHAQRPPVGFRFAEERHQPKQIEATRRSHDAQLSHRPSTSASSREVPRQALTGPAQIARWAI